MSSNLDIVKKQPNLLRDTLDVLPIIMTIWDLNFNILYCNAEIAPLLDITEKDDYIINFFKYTPEYQPDGTLSSNKIKDITKGVIATGRVECEWVLQDVHGNYIPLDIICTLGEFEGQDAIFVCCMDKSEVVNALDQLQLMLDTTPLAISSWDEHGNCLDCNLFAKDFFGFVTKEEYKKNVLDFAPTYQLDGTSSPEYWHFHINQAFSSNYHTFSFIAHKKNGTQAFFDVSAFRMDLNDQNVVMTYSRDVTEKTKVEIAQTNSEAKSRFLAHMSHEIRTPLTSILGISELQLHNQNLTPELEGVFAKIHNSSTTLLGIVNDILDLSAIEAGKISITEEVYDMAELINDVIQLHLVNLSHKDIKFKVDIDPNIPAQLSGDSLRIKQILNNIIGNAVKYTAKGLISVSLTCLNEDAESSYVELFITVKDTGKGMTKNDLDALFDEYTRFNASNSNPITGTGLGMSIIYNLLNLMGGHIDVESEIDKGTSVFMKIPQKMIDETKLGDEIANKLQQFEVVSSSKTSSFVREEMKNHSVLVVDDIEDNIYVAKGLLDFYKLNVDTCTSGFQAIDKIKEGKVYDIIFMDQMMPGISGIETTKLLRNMGYTNPIVALTANALAGQAEELMKNGFDEFISKPIKSIQLNSILNKFIKVKTADNPNNPAVEFFDNTDDIMDNPDFLHKMRTMFAKNQRFAYLDITQAIFDNDFKTAHRLAHTLKGLAKTINEMPLALLAEDIETIFKDGQIPDSTKLEEFNRELTRLLNQIEDC